MSQSHTPLKGIKQGVLIIILPFHRPKKEFLHQKNSFSARGTHFSHALNTNWGQFFGCYILKIPALFCISIPILYVIYYGRYDNSSSLLRSLHKSLYGLKQASHNWYMKLKAALSDREFKPSDIDLYIFLKPSMIVLVYADDCIIISDSKMKIDHLVHTLHHGPEKFVLTEEGTLDKFLGINIQPVGDDKYELSQPFLIERLVNLIEDGLELDLNSKETPTPVGKPLLHKDENGKESTRGISEQLLG